MLRPLQLLQDPGPHMLFWVEVRRVRRPIWKHLDAELSESTLSWGSVQQGLAIQQDAMVPPQREFGLQQGAQMLPNNHCEFRGREGERHHDR